MRKKQWNDLSTGTDEIQMINTQNVKQAEQGLVDLDYKLSAAYGFDIEDAKALDNEVHTYVPKKVKPITTVKPYDPSGTKPLDYYNIEEDEKQKLQAFYFGRL